MPQESSASTVSADGSHASERLVPLWRPLVAMSVGVAVVLLLMIGLKFHAFVALILGALAISCFIPLNVTGFNRNVHGPGAKPHVVISDQAEPVQIVSRVSSSLGNSVVGIGILIAMASVIGKCMLASGAADKIVQTSLHVFGQRRAAAALMTSGFILGIPVFFDTVFYLLVPLARSLYRQTGKDYLLYLCAIAAGGAITHTLVPPTPGPLLVAEALRVDIGPAILVGLCVGAPAAVVGLLVAGWMNLRMPVVMRPLSRAGDRDEPQLNSLPPLAMALLPVLLPVGMISLATVFKVWVGDSPSGTQAAIRGWLELLGSPNLSMVLAALISIYLCWHYQGHSLRQLSEHSEDALLSGGVIILITAAGGAFGNLLAMTEIQVAVEKVFASGSEQQGGLALMCLAFFIASLLKIAQGSSTVAMIIGSSLIAPIAMSLAADGNLGYHPVYLVPTIGAGSLVCSWMNDSGFWVFAKMGVLTEGETLRSWTIMLCILGVTSFAVTVVMATVMPLV
ncbi:MAG: hypothetical protein KF752_14180 [Pirellulaceae bacterium]|nr:hypothetical protein [Pirellulaceae bacterium]